MCSFIRPKVISYDETKRNSFHLSENEVFKRSKPEHKSNEKIFKTKRQKKEELPLRTSQRLQMLNIVGNNRPSYKEQDANTDELYENDSSKD